MGTRISIMDMDIDLLTQETFCEEIKGCLAKSRLSLYYMISLECIDTHRKSEITDRVLKRADMVIPGERAILTEHHVDVLERGGMVTDYHAFTDVADKWDKKNAPSFYLIMRDTSEAKTMFKYLAGHFSDDAIVGIEVSDGDDEDDILINDINAKTPDIIILSLPSQRQDNWLDKNMDKLNAKLIIATGSVMSYILKDHITIPAFMSILHLDSLYRYFANRRYSHKTRQKIFKKKLIGHRK